METNSKSKTPELMVTSHLDGKMGIGIRWVPLSLHNTYLRKKELFGSILTMLKPRFLFNPPIFNQNKVHHREKDSSCIYLRHCHLLFNGRSH